MNFKYSSNGSSFIFTHYKIQQFSCSYKINYHLTYDGYYICCKEIVKAPEPIVKCLEKHKPGASPLTSVNLSFCVVYKQSLCNPLSVTGKKGASGKMALENPGARRASSPQISHGRFHIRALLLRYPLLKGKFRIICHVTQLHAVN